MTRRRVLIPVLVLVAALAAVVAGLRIPGLQLAGADAPPLPEADVTASVGGPLRVEPLPSGFVGLSLEFQGLGEYVAEPGRNVVLEQLIRNLAPGQSPILRIGGDSTDHSWWPVRGVRVSPGLSYQLTPGWMRGVARLVHDLGARVIVGVNVEADSVRLAQTEARALLDGIGRHYVSALELGNEPNLYGVLPWWTHADGVWVRGRSTAYGPANYVQEAARIARALPPVPLAGPALGSLKWMRLLPSLLQSVPRLADVTFHRYPTNRCFTRPSEVTYPTIPNLLSPVASRGLAASVASFAATARAHGLRFRVDEMNSVACSGKAGVSDTFASALWAVDALFAMASRNVSGVNIHTFPGARYRLFTLGYSHGRWSATVAPEYYGLLMFARAAPPGSRLLSVRLRGPADIRAWATRTRTGALDIVLINDSPSRRHVVQVGVPRLSGRAVVERLLAPSLEAKAGVTLGGQSFAAGTVSGRLTGPADSEPAPLAGSGYRVTVPAASAVLLTIPGVNGR